MEKINQDFFFSLLDQYLQENSIAITNTTTATTGAGIPLYEYAYNICAGKYNPKPEDQKDFIKQVKTLFTSYINSKKSH